jgi:hypothetical protein
MLNALAAQQQQRMAETQSAINAVSVACTSSADKLQGAVSDLVQHQVCSLQQLQGSLEQGTAMLEATHGRMQMPQAQLGEKVAQLAEQVKCTIKQHSDTLCGGIQAQVQRSFSEAHESNTQQVEQLSSDLSAMNDVRQGKVSELMKGLGDKFETSFVEEEAALVSLVEAELASMQTRRSKLDALLQKLRDAHRSEVDQLLEGVENVAESTAKQALSHSPPAANPIVDSADRPQTYKPAAQTPDRSCNEEPTAQLDVVEQQDSKPTMAAATSHVTKSETETLKGCLSLRSIRLPDPTDLFGRPASTRSLHSAPERASRLRAVTMQHDTDLMKVTATECKQALRTGSSRALRRNKPQVAKRLSRAASAETMTPSNVPTCTQVNNVTPMKPSTRCDDELVMDKGDFVDDTLEPHITSPSNASTPEAEPSVSERTSKAQVPDVDKSALGDSNETTTTSVKLSETGVENVERVGETAAAIASPARTNLEAITSAIPVDAVDALSAQGSSLTDAYSSWEADSVCDPVAVPNPQVHNMNDDAKHIAGPSPDNNEELLSSMPSSSKPATDSSNRLVKGVSAVTVGRESINAKRALLETRAEAEGDFIEHPKPVTAKCNDSGGDSDDSDGGSTLSDSSFSTL